MWLLLSWVLTLYINIYSLKGYPIKDVTFNVIRTMFLISLVEVVLFQTIRYLTSFEMIAFGLFHSELVEQIPMSQEMRIRMIILNLILGYDLANRTIWQICLILPIYNLSIMLITVISRDS